MSLEPLPTNSVPLPTNLVCEIIMVSEFAKPISGCQNAHSTWHHSPSTVRFMAPPWTGHSTQGGGTGWPSWQMSHIQGPPSCRQAGRPGEGGGCSRSTWQASHSKGAPSGRQAGAGGGQVLELGFRAWGLGAGVSATVFWVVGLVGLIGLIGLCWVN